MKTYSEDISKLIKFVFDLFYITTKATQSLLIFLTNVFTPTYSIFGICICVGHLSRFVLSIAFNLKCDLAILKGFDISWHCFISDLKTVSIQSWILTTMRINSKHMSKDIHIVFPYITWIFELLHYCCCELQ